MKKLYRYISTPIVWYLIISFCGLTLCTASFFIENSKWNSVVIGLGSGLLASLFVAVLIDIGITRRKQQTDRENYNRLNEELRRECEYLPHRFAAHMANAFGEFDHPIQSRFEGWMKEAATENEKYVKDVLGDLATKAEELKYLAKLLPENMSFDDVFFRNIDALINTCESIRSAITLTIKLNYPVSELGYGLKYKVLQLYPELEDDYGMMRVVMSRENMRIYIKTTTENGKVKYAGYR